MAKQHGGDLMDVTATPTIAELVEIVTNLSATGCFVAFAFMVLKWKRADDALYRADRNKAHDDIVEITRTVSTALSQNTAALHDLKDELRRGNGKGHLSE